MMLQAVNKGAWLLVLIVPFVVSGQTKRAKSSISPRAIRLSCTSNVKPEDWMPGRMGKKPTPQGWCYVTSSKDEDFCYKTSAIKTGGVIKVWIQSTKEDS